MSAIKKLTKLENGNYQILVELDLVSYKSSQWKKAIDDMNETLQSGNLMLCELYAKPLYEMICGIDISNVSHKITKCYEDSGSVIVELETLTTPNGHQLGRMIEFVPHTLKFKWAVQGDNNEVTKLFQVCVDN